MTMVGDGSSALLVIGFESTDHPVDAPMERALEICREHGGEAGERGAAVAGGAACRWRRGLGGCRRNWRRRGLAGDTVRRRGERGPTRSTPGGRRSWRPPTCATCSWRWAISETFETAITWERFPAFHERVTAAAEQAMREVGAQPGGVSCRFTHVYPDGPAPYFTVLARGRAGGAGAVGGDQARGVGGDHRGGRHDHPPPRRRPRPPPLV